MPFGGPYTQLAKEVNLPLQAIPAVATAVTTVDTEVAELSVSNTTAGALTVTVTDGQSSAQGFLTTVNIPANSTTLIVSDSPILFKSGVKWNGSSTGLVGSLRGRSVLGLTLGANGSPA